MSEARIGIIGGSGLYQMDGLEITEERSIGTPFGAPSDAFILGNLDGSSDDALCGCPGSAKLIIRPNGPEQNRWSGVCASCDSDRTPSEQRRARSS